MDTLTSMTARCLHSRDTKSMNTKQAKIMKLYVVTLPENFLTKTNSKLRLTWSPYYMIVGLDVKWEKSRYLFKS